MSIRRKKVLLLAVCLTSNFPSIASFRIPCCRPPPSFRTALQATSRSYSRRDSLRQGVITLTTMITLVSPPIPATSVETIGKADDCNDSTCLGVWDGLLADCPHTTNGPSFFKTGAGCVSSQDDTPGIFAEPWDYSESTSLDWQDQMKVLLPAIQLVCARRNDKVQVEYQQGRYLRVLFTDKTSGEVSVGEFYFTPNDTTVQFRIGTTSGNDTKFTSFRNLERSELIRKQLRYTKIPVLRNRQRSFLFGESDDFDTFGPGSAMLGPPAEMTTGEIDSGRGSDDVDPKLKIDLVQKFPNDKLK